MRRRRRNKGKMVIGLTGSFGSGKTTVAGFFRSWGAEIIDADKIAHALMKPRTQVYKKIVKLFDKEIVRRDKRINRGVLAGMVFNNRDLLKRLNRIIRPPIIKIIKKRIKGTAKRVVVLDAPLLIEAGLKKTVDKLIVVTLTQDKQIERIRKKTALSRQEISKRIKAQLPLSHKTRLADFVIDNSGTIEETKKQVSAIRRLLWKS